MERTRFGVADHLGLEELTARYRAARDPVERARLACAQADMQEMKNAALRGALLPRDEVTAAVQACFSLVRARLLAIPTRAAPQVVLLKTMPEVKALLTALIHEALQELSETKVVALAEGATPVVDDDDAGDGELPDDNE